MDDILTQLAGLKRELASLWQRFLALENKITAHDPVFHNITSRLDAQGVELNRIKADLLKYHLEVVTLARALPELKAGLDTVLAQTKVQVKPKFKFPWQ